jgi:hypothetical protein
VKKGDGQVHLRNNDINIDTSRKKTINRNSNIVWRLENKGTKEKHDDISLNVK